ncbi:MAG: YcxB family protein [Lachnospiraceae bacterium]|nr:YcxB family protein [Lachnospiraceae bacterium]
MEYKFKMDIKPMDFFKTTMSRTYRSMTGVVNIVFTVAMILLAVNFLGSVNAFFAFLIIIGCILFPILHPLAIYGQSVKQTEGVPKGVELTFNDKGMHIEVKDKNETIPWKKIPKVVKQSDMVIVMSDNMHGYMLVNRVLGDKKEEFYEYVLGKIKEHKSK